MNDVVLETCNLTKAFGAQFALDHLTVSIPQGTICGFLGRNGAGKTTAIKLLLGLLRPTVGSATLLGCDAQALTPEIKARIGYVTEGHRLITWMTIQRIEQFQKAFYPDQWDSQFFADMIEYFDLSPKKKIKHLSNGQRAQVSLALTLAPNPELLIMDDPTLGLDPAIRRQFLEGMIHLIMNQGRTVLFSSHILADVERVCDRLLVLDRGVLRADCTLDQFRQSVKKVKIAFNDSPPESLDIPGLLTLSQGENELELLLAGTPEDTITQWCQTHGAVRHEIMPMTLEDQFIDFTAPRQTKRIMRWEAN
jgi:ABC-2 type transport system ATP-binding protein